MAHYGGKYSERFLTMSQHLRGGTLARTNVVSIYHRMALKGQPDQGVTNEAMQAMNELHKEIRNVG